jgi:acetyl-CoA C-acetyltransferase
MKSNVYLAGGARTPIGAFSGVFSNVSAIDLGVSAVLGALTRSGVSPDNVDEAVFGNVIGAGLGPSLCRAITLKAGLAPGVGAVNVAKVCGSGLMAVIQAARSVQCEDLGVVVAGGTENMSRAPYLLEKARDGYRMGHGELVDSLLRDGLWDCFVDKHMGALGEACAAEYEFSREDQDAFAVASYKRAIAAAESGVFQDEITPVEITTRKGVDVVSEDEEAARFNDEKFLKLRPAFAKDGTITAGNASSISDGAAAIVALSEAKVEELGVQPQAKILAYATFSREPEWFTIAPVGAIQAVLDQLSWTGDDVDLFEINEAFAVVPMAAMKDLNIPHEKVNVHGGAISLGHPIGASGARVLVTLLNALEKTGGKRGIASLCIGGGEGVAMAVELV